MHQRLIVGIVGVAVLSSCWASETQLRQRAVSDFQCDTEKLTVTEAGGGVYRVAGCDQSESYVYSNEAKAWLRESESGGKVIR